ncbi:MAG: hypothetical protein CL943_03980 [Candidatus Diapherotrites archaeon]|uniref:Uncharacterized protein n=1 Tax=Candidatus Iainarchaeum sp. TaxID=3101447 RepID=A0A2D6M1X6_9ARCH|nr:hypothetical protein [Candidatus Diapherotrites archaeon]|tara:strand:+ start:1627 stop:1944 length:318 start_codon:yes stop_codon:yes gene_type:complete
MNLVDRLLDLFGLNRLLKVKNRKKEIEKGIEEFLESVEQKEGKEIANQTREITLLKTSSWLSLTDENIIKILHSIVSGLKGKTVLMPPRFRIKEPKLSILLPEKK